MCLVLEDQPLLHVSSPMDNEPRYLVLESQPLLHASSPMDNEPRCLVPESQPLLHASSSMDNEPRCLVLESQPLLHASSSMDDEPRCLVLEDQHEHSNRTRNSLLNCLNVTPLNLTCHSNLIPQLDTNFSSITNCKSTFFII